MKISFVIPAFNEEKYLGDCLQSIVEQTQTTAADVEIIVVNNASTDRTREVAAGFANVVVVDEPRKGANFARQAGFLRASGDLIANIDADSRLAPGWLALVIKQFSHQPQLVALSGPVIYDDLPVATNLAIRLIYYGAFTSYLLTKYVFRLSSLVQGSNVAIRKTALDQIGGYNTAIAFYGDDTELARRLHPLGPTEFTFKLTVYTSGRRFQTHGLAKLGYLYIINYFSTIFLKKPWTTHYTDVRLTQSPKKSTNLKRLNNFLLGLKAIFGVMIFLGGFAFFHSPLQHGLVAEAHAMSKLHVHTGVGAHFHHAWLSTQRDMQHFNLDNDKGF